MKRFAILFSFLFLTLLLDPLASFPQETSKKDLRKLARQVKKGELVISKNADTIFIEKQIIKEVTVPEIHIQKETVEILKDTCIKERHELRHDRKMLKIEGDNQIALMRKENEALKIQAKSLKDSLSIIKKIEFERLETIQDTVREQSKVEKLIARSGVKKERLATWRYLSDNALYIILSLIALIFGAMIGWIFIKLKK